jgi:FKBP-type peptidyl-prolyl cis-trans isomerase 2
VAAVDTDEVTLDGNHPLAGLELTFALRLEAIE